MTSSLPPIVVRPPEARLPRRLDRYELIGEIARGGMGTVLLARLAGAGGFSRLFAIKLLHPHLAADEQFVHMLLDEARLASRIHHSNAVPIVDVCQSELGLYVVMDYIEGFTFTKILSSQHLEPQDRVRIGVQALLGVLGGLDAAHNLTDDDGTPFGLVHRDVSPSNVLVGLDGVARIADFGIAHAGTRITHTEPGLVKGKVAYMAPEQARGARIDRRADVFGVGVMLWECLTGKRLFKAENDAATVLKLLKEPIPPPSVVQPKSPIALDPVCLKALDREMERRYTSAHEMAADLSRAAERAGVLATSIEAADLLRSRFGEEITGRQAAIRAHCALLTTNPSGGVTPSHPQPAQRLRAVPAVEPSASGARPVTATLPPLVLRSEADTTTMPPSESSLLLEIAVDSPGHARRHRRALLAGAGLLAGVLILFFLLRGRHDGPPSVTPLPLPTATAPAAAIPIPPAAVLPGAAAAPTAGAATPAPPTGAATGSPTAAPAASPAHAVVPPAGTTPAAAPSAANAAPGAAPDGTEPPLPKKRSHHSHSSTHAEPALELNPYLHR